MKRTRGQKLSERGCVRLAVAVIDQAVEDLSSDDVVERENAERFLFGPYTLPLEHWLVRTGCTDVAEFQYRLKRRLEREQRKAA
jgi:hypothetical protein